MRDRSGISPARRPRGSPRPFQCSSSAAIASATCAPKPRSLTIWRSAPAARLDQLRARSGCPSGGELRHAARALEPRGCRGPRAPPRTARPEVAAPVHAREIALGHAVVAAEQLVDARRVARAADVLEQEAVVEVAALGQRQADALGDRHADQAAAERVPERLAFRDVERERQSAEHSETPTDSRWSGSTILSSERRAGGRERLRGGLTTVFSVAAAAGLRRKAVTGAGPQSIRRSCSTARQWSMTTIRPAALAIR